MSYFSHSLSKIIDSQFRSRQAAIAKTSGISTGMISRYLNHDDLPTPDQLQKLCNVLRTDLQADLVAAYIQSLIPNNLRNLVCVAVDPFAYRLKQEDFTQRVDFETRAALLNLAQLSILNPLARNVVLTTTRLLINQQRKNDNNYAPIPVEGTNT